MKGIEYASEYRLKLNLEPKKQWYHYIINFIDSIFDKLTPLKKEVKII